VDGGAFTLGPRFGLVELDELVDSFDRLLGRLDAALQAERRFSRDASHEMKTPLTVMRGELELLRGRRDLSPDARSAMERVAAQVEAMVELVEALLLLRSADPEPGAHRNRFEPVNLADLAREVVRTTLQRHPERNRDVVLSAPDEILVPAHSVLLTAAVRNLVDNAVKFTSTGERIQVSVEAASEASLVVDDAGRGVPEADREFIFDPFYRGGEARAETNGFGLGLPILRQVARAHGGTVVVEDSPLGGARFSFRMPLWTTS
jgi:two-component system, OmpR family, sensor kinase